METKHTPGPWRYTLGNDANAMNGEIRGADGELLNLRAVADDRDHATMRLMAAAPDLLAALLEVLEALPPPKNIRSHDGFRGNLAHAAARTAIHKATAA